MKLKLFNMEFKGTKGKWSVINEFRRPQVATDISKDIVCQVSQVWTKVIKDDDSESSVGQSHNEMMSTAKLIAAAPELLKVLMIAESYLHDADRVLKSGKTLRQLVRESINKALK